MRKLFLLCAVFFLCFDLAPAQEGCGEWVKIKGLHNIEEILLFLTDSVWVPKPCPKGEIKMSEKRIEFTKVKVKLQKDNSFKSQVIDQKVSIPLNILRSAVIEQHEDYYTIRLTKADGGGGWLVKEDPRKYLEEDK